MRRFIQSASLVLCLSTTVAKAGEREMVISTLPETGSTIGLPVGILFDLAEVPDTHRRDHGFTLSETTNEHTAAAIPCQFEPASPGSSRGTAWLFLPDAGQQERRLRFVADPPAQDVWKVKTLQDGQAFEFWEGDQRVLQYNHGTVPVREGTHAHFAAGESYERGDYIHPLYGPNGEELTEDYPRDHPHHRGVWWSWPVTRWNDQLADIWAVVGVWSRPERVKRMEIGPVFALLEAESTWKFGKDETPIATENVLIRAFRQINGHRVIDVELRLTALTDSVSIGGRPKAGYGGFAFRAAPCGDRQIVGFSDPEQQQPRRAWLDYCGQFQGGQGTSGVTIFEHVTNPDYPNPLHEYPQCNCVMPAYPEKREIELSKDSPLVLKHRLWIHAGTASENTLSKVWASYAHASSATVTTQ